MYGVIGPLLFVWGKHFQFLFGDNQQLVFTGSISKNISELELIFKEHSALQLISKNIQTSSAVYASQK